MEGMAIYQGDEAKEESGDRQNGLRPHPAWGTATSGLMIQKSREKVKGHVKSPTFCRWPDPPLVDLGDPQPAGVHTLQEPPKPMVIFSPATMTGTWRLPWVSRSISVMAWASSLTSRKMTVNPSLVLASRACRVKGHVFLPKMMISLVIATSLMGEVHLIDLHEEKIHQI
jgi:hypothetical protein